VNRGKYTGVRGGVVSSPRVGDPLWPIWRCQGHGAERVDQSRLVPGGAILQSGSNRLYILANEHALIDFEVLPLLYWPIDTQIYPRLVYFFKRLEIRGEIYWEH